jgi:thioredoxin reductase (NADPH)
MSEDKMKVENVIIVGGGPAGYTAALYTARANLEPLVFEGFQWGGQLQNTTDVENYPGYPDGIMGPEMMSQFRAQAERFGTRFVTDDVDRVELSEDGGVHKVFLGDEEHRAKTVILAMGAEPKRLGVPGEMELAGRGVSTCGVCDGAFFKGHRVLVIGGGDSAMEDSIFISKFADELTIVNRRDEFRASKIMLERAMAHPQIKFMSSTLVEEVLGVEDKDVKGLRLKNAATGEQSVLPVSAMFLGIGHEPNAKAFTGLLDLDPDGYILTKNNVFTTKDGQIIPGVFACGDIQDRRYRQAITAAGSGCMAALEVEKYLEEHGR